MREKIRKELNKQKQSQVRPGGAEKMIQANNDTETFKRER